MNGEEVITILIKRLLEIGFIVHRHNAYSTSSVYLKLDYGLCCGIRIADHPGRKRYHYRFNVMKNYNGNKVIERDGLVCLFFDFNELEKVLDAVQKEKQRKISKYGINKYKSLMDKEREENKLFKRFREEKV